MRREAARSTEPAGHALRQAALDFDLKRLDASFLADPFPLYRALREHDPVHRMPDGSFFLSRYDDCVAVYRAAETWSSDKKVDFRPNFGASLLYERLLGFHFKTVIAAIRVLTIHPDGDAAARELARKAVSALSAADEPAFRAAIEKALEGHISAGRILRDEHDHLGDIERVLEKSAAGKRKRPSKSRT